MFVKSNIVRGSIMVAVLSGALLAAGCSGAMALKDVSHVQIEKKDSISARVRDVKIMENSNGAYISVDLIRSSLSRGPIGGHIHVEVLGRDGTVLQDSESYDVFPSNSQQFSTFNSDIETLIENISILRVSHHDSWSDEDGNHNGHR